MNVDVDSMFSESIGIQRIIDISIGLIFDCDSVDYLLGSKIRYRNISACMV